jgi:adenylate cyclase
MAEEIERKFLPKSDVWRARAHARALMSQGYVAKADGVSVRVRIAGERAWLNIKAGKMAASRLEFEYAIPLADARELLKVATGPLIEKTRHYVDEQGFEWEVDEFHGANQGLVVAEIELEREDQAFPHPDWVGPEVTHLERYYNVSLVNHPYAAWTETERSP